MAGAEREVQYDRQLRLWGGAGQRALEGAHVCLCGAGPLGTETLKALVLPGLGALTVVDGALVTEADVGASFFLEATSVGRGRAAESVRLLLELNPAVRGAAVAEDAEHLLRERPDFFHGFTLVLACGLPERTLTLLAADLWTAGVPLLVARSVGFLSALRVQVREHAVLEAHPDNQPRDLRLLAPFPALSQFVDSFDLETMEFKDHAHVPWLVIVYKAVQAFKALRGGESPKNYKDKEQIREIIRSWIMRDENGIPMDEENFQEAIRAVNSAVVETSVPKAVRSILCDEACKNLTQKSLPFWIMCAALRGFTEEEGAGALPLGGSLPDMTSSTEHYIALQNIYRAKAAADAEAVYKRVGRLVAELGVENISEVDVRSVCKHSSSIYVVRGSCLADEYEKGGAVAGYVARHLEEPDPMMVHYVMLRGAERFKSEQCRAPGEWDPETDIPKLKTCVTKMLSEWSCSPLAEDDYVHEMCRYGGAELHSVSAFMGGCAAQEAIKLITKQYIPVDNFFIHEAMMGKSATFTF